MAAGRGRSAPGRVYGLAGRRKSSRRTKFDLSEPLPVMGPMMRSR